MDVAIEAELDPRLATPPHLREGDRVRDRVEERAELRGAHGLQEKESGGGTTRGLLERNDMCSSVGGEESRVGAKIVTREGEGGGMNGIHKRTNLQY